MPLFYYARQSQIATKEGVKTWHLSLKKVGKVVDTQLLAERKKIRWDEKSYDLSSNNLKFRDNEYKSISLG